MLQQFNVLDYNVNTFFNFWLLLRRQLAKHPKYVFTYKENPVGGCSTKAWINDKKRTGISDFRWHDLMHTWAS